MSLDGSVEVIPDPFGLENVRDIAVKKPAPHDPSMHQDGDEIINNDIETAANSICKILAFSLSPSHQV